MKKRKIGLFFGSFNPVHNGHLMLANYIVEYTDLDSLWFVVSPQNPFKDESSLLQDRYRFDMLKLSVKDDTRFEVCDIETGADYLENREKYDALGENVVYTGTIDSFYGYQFGKLEYRSLKFETELLDSDNYQGVAVVNYTDRETPFTRIIEHKHFEFGIQPKTVITREYPADWQEGMEPYYPVNDARNQELYGKYAKLAETETNVIFGGRLAEYKYYDMDKVIESALKRVKEAGLA